MEETGEEKLIAVARHIAKTLGHNESMADDILQIFSNFDGRFSREKLSDKLDGAPGEDLRACVSIAQTLESLERQISQYVAADHPIWSDSADSSAFLDSIDELNATIRYWTPMAATDKTVGAYLIRADEFMQQAMFRLEEEFRLLMERGSENLEADRNELYYDDEDDDDDEDDLIPVAQPLDDYQVVIDSLPPGTIGDLHEIAKRMVGAGFGEECARVYSSCRRRFVEESMARLGLEKMTIEEVQKCPWQELEDEIERWIKGSNVALRILYPSERRLCDRVFFGFSSAADLSFMEVCRGSTIQILNFADAVAIGSRSPERLFKILDLFETLRDLMPEFESNFSDQYCVVLRNNAVAIWKRLGESIRGIFMELENLIRRDPAKAPVPYGGLHPITRYVMNYLRAACRSRETLEQVFEENVKVVLPMKDYSSSSSSSLSVQIAWIMELLESNLEMKSKIYGDSALSYVFMMNNGRYIIQKVRDSELGSLLGEDWIRKHSAKIKQFLMGYQRSSWSKIIDVLKVENGGGKSLSMKEKIRLFNTYFEDIYKTQSHWIIFDEQLRKDLRMSLAKLLIPVYGSFVERFQNSPEVGKHPHRCIKYSVKDIEVQIDELFQGTPGSAGSRK
ncbi:exocyst subunit exo70 family protein B1 [Euphorbia peplus]|nr:exocyst subunit exo70 family protein B1 [Euphorbia peplus]